MRVVIDTNVVVSAFLSPAGVPAQLMQRLQQEAFEMLVSEPILWEYRQALGYPKVRARHGLYDATLDSVIDNLSVLAILAEPDADVHVVEDDAEDDKFFACAIAGSADFIVSGDKHVLAVGEYRGIRVLPAALFLALLDAESRA